MNRSHLLYMDESFRIILVYDKSMCEITHLCDMPHRYAQRLITDTRETLLRVFG